MLRSPSISKEDRAAVGAVALGFEALTQRAFLSPLFLCSDDRSEMDCFLLSHPEAIVSLTSSNIEGALCVFDRGEQDAKQNKMPAAAYRLIQKSPELADFFFDEMTQESYDPSPQSTSDKDYLNPHTPEHYFFWEKNVLDHQVVSSLVDACCGFASDKACLDLAKYHKDNNGVVPAQLRARVSKILLDQSLQDDDVASAKLSAAKKPISKM